jgi:phytoene synthase
MDGLSPARAPSSGSSFHYSFGLLPADRRRALEAVYAFSRAVDNVADEGPRDAAPGERALRLYRDELARCYDGAPTLPVARALRDAIVRFGIRVGHSTTCSTAWRWTCASRYASFERCALASGSPRRSGSSACRSSAASTRRAATTPHPRHRPASNILRPQGDAARGRICPIEEMRRCGYGEDELLRGSGTTPTQR